MAEEGPPPMSPGDLMVMAERWLEENIDAPLVERVTFGITFLCRGDRRNTVTFGEIGRLLDVPPSEVLQACLALRDRAEASS